MSTETPAEEFTAEQTARVYLNFDPEARRWIVTPSCVDGYALDGYACATADLSAENWEAEDHAIIEAANQVPIPNADQLVLLLLEALPETSTVKTAVREVLAAAQNWRQEITEYMAPSSALFNDAESEASQRATAEKITAALALLS